MSGEGSPLPRRSGLLVLSYVGFLGLFSLLAAKRDPEVRWHAFNGLLLFGALAAVGLSATLIGIAVPALSCLYAVAMLIASLLYLLIAVLAIVKALNGQRLMIPGISTHAARLAGEA
jgi:uncharacterized membrane protein